MVDIYRSRSFTVYSQILPTDCRIFQLAGIGDQVAEIYGIYERKSFYRHYNPAMHA